jgi:hypothetical protein
MMKDVERFSMLSVHDKGLFQRNIHRNINMSAGFMHSINNVHLCWKE